MTKANLKCHAAWLTVASGAYLAGSFWGSDMDDSSKGAPVSLPNPGLLTETFSQEEGAVTETDLTSVSHPKRERQNPLSEEAIEDLAKASTRSPSPIERQLAFARILEAMESDSFNAEQAKAMRSALFRNGASGEQWRLFDYAWAARDPRAAIAHLADIADEHRAGFLGNMLPGLASVDPKTAIEVFEGLEPFEQSQHRKSLYEGLIDNDPALATDYVYEAASPENPDWRPMDTFARELANDLGLEATLDWATELPEGSLRGNAWSAAYAKWASEDPHAAVASIVEMPASPDRNQAINGFISALAGQDPQAAVTWAAEITEPHMRDAALVRAGTRFFQQDQGAAETWFQSSGLPEEALGRMQPN